MLVKYFSFVAYFFFIKICWKWFCFLSFNYASSSASITSSHIIAELSIRLANIFHFHNYMKQDSRRNVFHIHYVFYIHINIYHYSTIDLNYIFLHQISICIGMIYALLMFSIYLFL